jgi:hypothetical protein
MSMTLIHVSIDPVLVEELLLGTVGAVASVIGAIAVLKAASHDRGSPTKSEQGMLPVLAGRLSMTVAAQDRMSDPLNMRFSVSDPAVTLLRIELANQLDKGVGIARCIGEAPRIFVAAVEPKIVQRWYNANAYWDGETKRLPIRVFLLTNGRAACRTIWVAMRPRAIPSSGLSDVNDFAWFLEGPCSRALPQVARMPSRARAERL